MVIRSLRTMVGERRAACRLREQGLPFLYSAWWPRWLWYALARVGIGHVSDLMFEYSSVDDRTLVLLDNLPFVETLSVRGTRVTNEGVRHLVHLKALSLLDVGETAITDTGLEFVGLCGSLEHLFLDTTPITDGGLRWIEKLSQLRDIVLDNTAVTDQGMRYLARLKGLRFVQVWHTCVTAAGAHGLKQVLPECDINWGPSESQRSDKGDAPL